MFLRPDPEAARLEALQAYGILDTAPDPSFDDLTALASRLFGCPISLISLVDRDRLWFKSRVGLTIPEMPREASFCGHAILSDEVMVIRDAAADRNFAKNTLVAAQPQVRFYAGAPLIAPSGLRLGTSA